MENEFSLDLYFLYKEQPNYARELHNILNTYNKDKNIGIRKAKDFKKKQDQFLAIIKRFEDKYDNAEEYLDALYEIADSYDDKKVKTKTISEKRKLLNEIYNSGLSYIDYCFYNYINIKNYYPYLYSLKEKNNKMAEEILNREIKTLPKIKELVDKIINDEIDPVEYFEITKMNPNQFFGFIKEYKLACSIGKIFSFVTKIDLNAQNINIDFELENKLVINSVEISREMKEEAINYLKKIEAPLTSINYNTMIKRLIKSSN